MSRIVIRGWAAVFRDDAPVTGPAVLRTLDGLAYEDERFTDYLGGPKRENELLAALEPSGYLRFNYRDGEDRLSVTTEYTLRRPLTDPERALLVRYTLGQWSDGIGENWASESVERCGLSIVCLTVADDVGPNYPSVEILDD
ncbi:MAG TPA: hypothetical protein VGE52_02805 [Pirellulales bacterium]